MEIVRTDNYQYYYQKYYILSPLSIDYLRSYGSYEVFDGINYHTKFIRYNGRGLLGETPYITIGITSNGNIETLSYLDNLQFIDKTKIRSSDKTYQYYCNNIDTRSVRYSIVQKIVKDFNLKLIYDEDYKLLEKYEKLRVCLIRESNNLRENIESVNNK